jgi:DeoR family glycerol-3-phosphate regulon repressor
MVRLGSIEEIDALFTDRQPPPPLLEVLSAADVRLHVASGADAHDGHAGAKEGR